MMQSIVPFSALVSMVALKRRYTFRQVTALVIVFTGFLVAWVPLALEHSNAPGVVRHSIRHDLTPKSVLPFLARDLRTSTSKTASGHVWIQRGRLRHGEQLPRSGTSRANGQDENTESGKHRQSVDGSLPSGCFFAIICALSTLPTALSFALKEKVVLNYREWVQQANNVTTAEDDKTYYDEMHMDADELTAGSLDPSVRDERELGQSQVQHCGTESVVLEATGGERGVSTKPRVMDLGSSETERRSIDRSCSDDKRISVFVICLFASLFQLMVTPFSLPINTLLGQTHGETLTCYAYEAYYCFRGLNPSQLMSVFEDSCRGMPPHHQVGMSLSNLWNTATWSVESGVDVLKIDTESGVEMCDDDIADVAVREDSRGALEKANKVWWGATPSTTELCQYALPSYVVYVVVNVVFNLFLIGLLRVGSSLLAFLTLKAVLPLSIILFYAIPWPLLSQNDVHLTAATMVSLFVIGCGVFFFEYERQQVKKQVGERQPPCCFPVGYLGWRYYLSSTQDIHEIVTRPDSSSRPEVSDGISGEYPADAALTGSVARSTDTITRLRSIFVSRLRLFGRPVINVDQGRLTGPAEG
eukprot:GHVQ01043344.1.p1 GENE.GHVQ01043344.1~~GHVQ01043344.1.p1  ORF type:complete len:587 (-),score=69.54 GHVQ01043344.1:2826-4586(-)